MCVNYFHCAKGNNAQTKFMYISAFHEIQEKKLHAADKLIIFIKLWKRSNKLWRSGEMFYDYELEIIWYQIYTTLYKKKNKTTSLYRVSNLLDSATKPLFLLELEIWNCKKWMSVGLNYTVLPANLRVKKYYWRLFLIYFFNFNISIFWIHGTINNGWGTNGFVHKVSGSTV